jgi:hypothetical protein
MAFHSRKLVPTPLPPIIITDHTTSPPVTVRYTCGHNDISFPTAYTAIKSLLTHPACPHRPNSFSWPCHPCEYTFTTKYWTCAATLLDYFADFYPTDTPLMQSIWFYLLDIWQESALNLPYESVLEDAGEAGSGTDPVWGKQEAKAFEKAVRDTVTLFEVTIWGRRQEADTGDQVVYDPRGEAWCPVGEYETGPWVSGVKPWGQFLSNGGVGVAAPFRSGGGGATTITAINTEENGKKRVEAGLGNAEHENNNKTTRYIPLPAIGLIEAHTARTRTLATTLFTKQDPDLLTTSLAHFNAHTVALPSSRNKSHSYTSRITGLETTYTLSNGAPPVLRYAGLGDPQMETTRQPDWNLLDECVASCRGVTAYLPVSGGGEEGEDGDGDGDGDGDEVMEDSEEEEEVPFDLWTVVERRVGGDRYVRERGNSLDLGDMFESWGRVDEF